MEKTNLFLTGIITSIVLALVSQESKAVTLTGPFRISNSTATSKWSLNGDTGTVTTELESVALLNAPTNNSELLSFLNGYYQNSITQNWNFVSAPSRLNGEFVVLDYYACALNGPQLPCGSTLPGDNSFSLDIERSVGAAFSMFYRPGVNDPPTSVLTPGGPNPSEFNRNLNWVQIISVEGGPIAGISRFLDTGAQGVERPPFYHSVLFAPDPESPGSNDRLSIFADAPQRADFTETWDWSAELYLTETNGSQVTLYDGISWGWSTTVTTDPPPPPPSSPTCSPSTSRRIVSSPGSGGGGVVISPGSGGGGVGCSQNNPILANQSEGNKQTFKQVPRRRWYDPITSYGFEFETLGDDLFTGILDFPIGLDNDNLFTVSANNLILGEFGPGDSLDFTDLFGDGIDKFTITDISGLGPTPETAFPILLDFNNETVDFTMTRLDAPKTHSVPEPNPLATVVAIGLFTYGVFSFTKL
jgi:hypothetical protein